MGWDGIHYTVTTKVNIFSGPKRNFNEQEVWVKSLYCTGQTGRPKLTYQYQHDPDKEIIITTMVMMIITTQTGMKIITTLTDDHDHYYHPDHA